MSENPFAPLGAAGKPRLKVAAENPAAELVSPIPGDAPKRPAVHPKLGKPSAIWTYNDAAGEPIGFAMRFDPPGGKEFRPLALYRTAGGALEWGWRSWPAPRPLYGLDLLAEDASAPVVVTEGEKSADAAQRLLPKRICITSPNGSKSAGKADWSPLAGRYVTIWPDADEPGEKYAEDVKKLALAAGAVSVAIIAPPAGVAAGWDAANAEAEGWDMARAEALVASAKAAAGGKGKKAADDDDGKPQRRKRGGEMVLNIIDEAGCEFWHGPDHTAYVTFPAKRGHRENRRVESKEFARWIASRAYAQGLTPPSKGTLDDSLRLLCARALDDGPLREPWLRVGAEGGAWFLDLGRDDWSVVKITRDGWQVLHEHDCPMLRSPAMTALPMPAQVMGDSIAALRPFANTDEAGFALLVAWLLAALRPRGPFPILMLNGEQGSAKSTLSRLLRSLVDPNIAPVRSPPKDETDLIVSARNAHVLALDNVSSISGDLSDALCRIATGGGFSARVKYSDAEENVAYVKNPIILNGIPSFASRPDLASRSLIVRLEPIPDDLRKTEEEIETEWAAAAPTILGALLDVLSFALSKLEKTKPPRAARMADFERLIEAASPRMGWPAGWFSSIYQGNRDELDAGAIEADPVASALISFIHDDEPRGWAGTATRLLDLLSPKVGESIRRSRGWPQTPIKLSNDLARAAPLLRRHGITIARKHSGERTLTIMVAEAAPAAPEAP